MDERIREQHIKITRNRICSGYLDLLKENPPKYISVTDICKRANVSRGTFYNHFIDTDDLTSYINNWLSEAIKPCVEKHFQRETRGSEDSLEFLKGIMTVLFSWQEYSRVILCSENGRTAIETAGELITDEYLKWLDKFHPGYELRSARYNVAMYIGCGVGVLRRWISDGFNDPPDYLLRFFSRLKTIHN